MEKRAIVLANGKIEDPLTIRQRLKSWKDAIVIAADGGYLHAETLDLEIQSIVGDLDSMSEDVKTNFLTQGTHIQSFPPEKDETDLELALLHAVDLDVDRILILGAIGGRLDMTLSNLHLMLLPQLEQVKVEAWYGNQTLWIIRPPGDEILGQRGDTLSLIPVAGTVKGITTSHIKYPLKNENLSVGLSRGLSNVLTASDASIDLQEGLLFVIHTPGYA